MSLQIPEQLIQQRRYQEAEAILRQYLAESPDYGAAHSMLALTLAHQERNEDALFEANLGIQYAVNIGYSYQAQAIAYRGLGKYYEAARAIQTAIQLEPKSVEYHILLALIRLDEQIWDEAIRVTDTALQLEPQNTTAITIRARAMRQIGQTKEAEALLKGLVTRGPDQGSPHAAQGWAMLHEGQINEAIVHFQEMLRLDPDDTYAQTGLIEALKARNPFYRVMLTYFLWMSRLSRRTQWLLIVGGFIGIQTVVRIGNRNPDFEPVANVLLIIYSVFVYLTWTSSLLSDLLLRLHRVGRFALPVFRRNNSNWAGGFLLVAIGFLVGALFADGNAQRALLGSAVKTVVLLIPLAGVFATANINARSCLFYWTIGLVLLALLGLKYTWDGEPPVNPFDVLFMLGVVGFMWVASAVLTSQRNPFKPQ